MFQLQAFMFQLQDHVIVSYRYGAGQMKLTLPKDLSATVKQSSHITNFIMKKKIKAIKVP